jgi:predicted permease
VLATACSGERFEWRSLTQFLKTPLFPAIVLGLFFRTAHVPDYIMAPLGYIGSATVTLSMISIGLGLSATSLKDYPLPLIAAAVLKMGLFPVLMWLLLGVSGVSGTVAKAALLESAMPSAVFGGVVASKFGANGRFAAAAIFFTTLLSAAVIPIVLNLMR